MNRISDRLSELTQPTGEEPILDVSYPTPRLKIVPWQAIVAALAIIISVLLWLALTSPPDSDQLPAGRGGGVTRRGSGAPWHHHSAARLAHR